MCADFYAQGNRALLIFRLQIRQMEGSPQNRQWPPFGAGHPGERLGLGQIRGNLPGERFGSDCGARNPRRRRPQHRSKRGFLTFRSAKKQPKEFWPRSSRPWTRTTSSSRAVCWSQTWSPQGRATRTRPKSRPETSPTTQWSRFQGPSHQPWSESLFYPEDRARRRGLWTSTKWIKLPTWDALGLWPSRTGEPCNTPPSTPGPEKRKITLRLKINCWRERKLTV